MTGHLSRRAGLKILFDSLLSPARGGTDLRDCSERESRNGPGTAPPVTRATPSTKRARADGPAGRLTQGGRVHGQHR